MSTITEVAPCCRTKLVHALSLFPHRGSSLNNSNQLLCDLLRKHVFPAPSASPLLRSVEYPFEGLPPSLPQTKWYWNLKSDTTTSRTLL